MYCAAEIFQHPLVQKRVHGGTQLTGADEVRMRRGPPATRWALAVSGRFLYNSGMSTGMCGLAFEQLEPFHVGFTFRISPFGWTEVAGLWRGEMPPTFALYG